MKTLRWSKCCSIVGPLIQTQSVRFHSLPFFAKCSKSMSMKGHHAICLDIRFNGIDAPMITMGVFQYQVSFIPKIRWVYSGFSPLLPKCYKDGIGAGYLTFEFVHKGKNNGQNGNCPLFHEKYRHRLASWIVWAAFLSKWVEFFCEISAFDANS